MKVAFGVSVLARSVQQGGVDGIGTYTRELMAAMPQGVQLQPYVFGPASLWTGAVPAVAAGRFGTQALLSNVPGGSFRAMRRALGAGVDLVHATDHLVPRMRGIPVVATFFDAIPLAHPEWIRYRFKALKNEMWRRTAFWAQRIITISEYSRQEIAEHFRVPVERITAIPLGVGPGWFDPVDAAQAAAVRARHALPERYFVTVGTLQPRKNIARLLAAHSSLPLRLQREFPLLVVGKPGWGCEDVVARFSDGTLPNVRWLRHLPDADLRAVVKSATALVFPSLHEGFGLPVLEGFAAGVPVAASHATSIPEVAGDAALLFDPLRTDDVAHAMARIAEQPALAHQLAARGRERVRSFTWQACAEKTVQVYQSVL
ncbi:glycosyltransferase family 1 protein [Acidovorax sp.]|uniref:glycosyltransferase family 4 protein n=1 Tax=Acidovorax sp. TaxID=1872122 RepID=UPI0025C6A098|nr:glycosyltransferase family 1 protein [Acidovorax sp.]